METSCKLFNNKTGQSYCIIVQSTRELRELFIGRALHMLYAMIVPHLVYCVKLVEKCRDSL